MSTTSSKNDHPAPDLAFWDAHRNVIRTRKGGAQIGAGRVTSHGYSILDDLVGRASYFQILMLNITGRLPEERLARWVEATFSCLSWPDARIWCNLVSALGGTVRTSPVAAITAGILASDSKLYGPGTMIGATAFITRALAKRKQGDLIVDIVNEYSRRPGTKPIIPGYARPLAYGDERVIAMEKITSELGYGIDDHMAVAYEVQDYLFEHYQEGLNLAGYMMAFLSDRGLTATEIYRLYALCVNNGIHACYAEAYDRTPESFLPMRCDDIEYQGQPYRPVPPRR